MDTERLQRLRPRLARPAVQAEALGILIDGVVEQQKELASVKRAATAAKKAASEASAEPEKAPAGATPKAKVDG